MAHLLKRIVLVCSYIDIKTVKFFIFYCQCMNYNFIIAQHNIRDQKCYSWSKRRKTLLSTFFFKDSSRTKTPQKICASIISCFSPSIHLSLSPSLYLFLFLSIHPSLCILFLLCLPISIVLKQLFSTSSSSRLKILGFQKSTFIALLL